LEEASRLMWEKGYPTLRKSREMLETSKSEGFVNLLTKRERTGSAENPITKMFPATITEQRFVEKLDELVAVRSTATTRTTERADTRSPTSLSARRTRNCR